MQSCLQTSNTTVLHLSGGSIHVPHLFTHADLHDSITDESFFEVTVFLLFKPLNVHPSTLHKLSVNKAHADFRSHTDLCIKSKAY